MLGWTRLIRINSASPALSGEDISKGLPSLGISCLTFKNKGVGFLLASRHYDFPSLSHSNIILGRQNVSVQHYLPRKRNQIPCQGLEKVSSPPAHLEK